MRHENIVEQPCSYTAKCHTDIRQRSLDVKSPLCKKPSGSTFYLACTYLFIIWFGLLEHVQICPYWYKSVNAFGVFAPKTNQRLTTFRVNSCQKNCLSLLAHSIRIPTIWLVQLCKRCPFDRSVLLVLIWLFVYTGDIKIEPQVALHR